MPAQSPPLAESRSFPVDEIKTFRRKGGRLQGHSVLGKPGGVANSAGAPGMGLSFGVGIWMGMRRRGIETGMLSSWAAANRTRARYGRLRWLQLTMRWTA